MIRWKTKIRKIQIALINIGCIVFAYVYALAYYKSKTDGIIFPSKVENILFVIIIASFAMAFMTVFNIYNNTIGDSGKAQVLISTNISIVISIICTKVVFDSLGANSVTVLLMKYYALFLCILITLARMVQLKVFKMVNERILILGYSNRGQEYLNNMSAYEHLGMKIIGYANVNEDCSYENLNHLGSINDLVSLVQDHNIDEITVACSYQSDARTEKNLDECQKMGVTITMLLECDNQTSSIKKQVAMVGHLPALKFHTVSLNETQLFVKRIFDIIGASIGMILFGIAFLIFAPLIKLESKGPVIFKQLRVGRNGRLFKIFKFRSMKADSEKNLSSVMDKNECVGALFKIKNDPRITRIGRFMRNTSIDELPQFWNVMKGDMSLVGTRPPLIDEVEQYELYQRKRISIVPGITGNWQVHGRSNLHNFEEVLQMDVNYIENWSLQKDINIIFRTFLVVLRRDGSE